MPMFLLSPLLSRHQTLGIFFRDADETIPRHYSIIVIITSLLGLLTVDLWFVYVVRRDNRLNPHCELACC